MGRGGRQGSVPGLSPESQTHENNRRNTETKTRTSDVRVKLNRARRNKVKSIFIYIAPVHNATYLVT